jgi:outer membrane protein assembly factor BamB
MGLHIKLWFLVLVSLLGSAKHLRAQDNWPVFRGDGAQSGVASAPLPNSLALAWSFKAQDSVEGAPTIVEQTVYVGAMDRKLYALDLASGVKKWHYQAGAIKAAPAVRDGAVYVGDLDGTFHCLDAATGKKRWSLATQGEIVSSANFYRDKIIFGSHDHHLYCVTPDGKIEWKFKTQEKVHGSPAVVGDRILLAGCDQSLHVVDAATGQGLAVIPLGGHVAASAAVRAQHLYVGTMANQFLAVDWKKGAILWQFESKRGPQPFYASPAVTDELVIAGSRDKKVRAWQRLTGKEVWAFPTKGRVDSSPVIAGRHVVVGSLDGNLYVLDLADGTKVAHFELGPIAGSPAVGGQAIVVGTVRGEVFCIGTRR